MQVSSYYIAASVAELKALAQRPSVVQLLDGIYIWTPGSTRTGNDVTVIEPTTPTPAGRYILSLYGPPGAPPGHAYALFANEAPYITSGPVVSPTLWPIKNITEHPTNNTFVLTFQTQPIVPSTGLPPTSLQIRVDAGMSMVTYGAHPLSLRVAQPILPTASPYEFEVPGVPYEDSVFLGGHCYASGVALIDGAPLLNELGEYCRSTGLPSVVVIPPGLIYAQTEVIRAPEGCNYGGAGKYLSGFVLADRADQPGANLSLVSLAHLFETGAGSDPATYYRVAADTVIHDLTFYGNRGFQIWRRGTHCVAVGGTESATEKRNNLKLLRLAIIGSAGYGLAWSGDSPHIDYIGEDIDVWFCDGDGSDLKNRVNGNARGKYRGWDVRYWAMGSVGTALEPVVTLPINCITTTSGSADFVVTARYAYLTEARPGSICTLSNAPTFNGIDLNDNFKCIGVSGNTVILRGTTTASASSTGGGSGILADMPHFDPGDAAIDTRCPYVSVTDCYVEGFWLNAKSGVRQRGGTTSGANGEGSTYAVFDNIRGKDITPAWVAETQIGELGSLISLEGTGATVSNCKFIGTGSSSLLRADASSLDATISNCVSEGAARGYLLQGENIVVQGGVVRDWTDWGIRVHGAIFSVTRDLPDDPFLCKTLGAAVVIVSDPGHPLITGDDVAFVAPQSAYGVVIEGSNIRDYSVTVINANSYEITAAGAATNITDAFGGDDVDARYPPLDHVAQNIQIRDVTFHQTTPSTTAIPFALGLDTAGGRGQASNIVVTDCHVQDATGRVVDYAEDVVWGPGNTGDLSAYNPDEGYSEVWEEVPGGLVVVSENAAYLDFTQITKPLVRVEVEGAQHLASSNVSILVSPDKCVTLRNVNGDYQRVGSGAGTSTMIIVATVAAATPYGASTEATNFTRVVKTFFTIKGGAVESTSGLVGYPGFTTSSEVLNGIRINCASSVFTAGTFRVMQKDG